MPPIRLVLADDHLLVVRGLEQLFSSEPDFSLVATCGDGVEALRAVREHRPDILVLDLAMPRMDGLTVMRRLHDEDFAVRVVILTAALDEDAVLEAIRLGVRGVVLKEMAPQLLMQCLRIVHAGGEWLEKKSVRQAIDKLLRRESEVRQIKEVLTPREIELVRMVAKGLSNKAVAREAGINEGTVKVHLHNIYEKLQVRSRVALTIYVKDRGLV